MSWPLSLKHAAKITFAQCKCRAFQSIIYPADKNNFIGISSILAWRKSRVDLPHPLLLLWYCSQYQFIPRQSFRYVTFGDEQTVHLTLFLKKGKYLFNSECGWLFKCKRNENQSIELIFIRADTLKLDVQWIKNISVVKNIAFMQWKAIEKAILII